MKKQYPFLFLLLIFFSGSVKAQLAGTYSVGSGGDYTTLKLAFDDINTNGISANVTLEIVDGHIEDDRFLLFDYAGKSSFDLLILPEAGATSVILENTSSRHVLELTQVDNITIDGRAGGTGDPVMTIRKITGSFGRTPVKVTVLAGATAKVTSCILEYTGYGIQAAGSGDVDIENNHLILNSGASFYVRGIHLTNFTGNVNINGNLFEGTEAPGILTYSGIYTDNSLTSYTAFNNVMTIVASATTNAGANDGYIAFDSFDAENIDIFHNTVIITEGSTVPKAAWMVSSNPTGNLNVKNNIFELNTTSSTEHGFVKHQSNNGGTVEYFANNNSPSTSSIISPNYRVYQPGQTGAEGANPSDFPDIFKKLSSEIIAFTDEANRDYTLSGASLAAAGVRSSIVTSVTTDFNGDARDGTVPTKGAFEVPVPANSTSLYDFDVPGFDVTVLENGIINLISENEVTLSYTPSFVIADGAVANLREACCPTPGDPLVSGVTLLDVVADLEDYDKEFLFVVTAPDGTTTKTYVLRISSINRIEGGTYSVGSGGDYETLEEAIKSIRSFGIDGDVILELKNNYSGSGLNALIATRQISGMAMPENYGITIRPEPGATSVVFAETISISSHNIIIDGRAGGVGDPVMEITYSTFRISPVFQNGVTSPDQSTKIQHVIFRGGTTRKLIIDQNSTSIKGDVVVDHCIFDDELNATAATSYIEVENVRNLTISNNKFFNIRTSDSNPAITSAIDLTTDEIESVNIYNNAITMNARGTATFYGIHAQPVFNGDLNISHNSIHFFRGAFGSTGQLSGIVIEGDPASLAIQNNIISNEGSEFSSRTGISWLDGTGTRTIQYNNVSGLAPLNYTDGDNVNTTEAAFLAFEPNSTAVSMTFTDEDNGDLSPTSDLLDNANLRTDLDAGITTDILGMARRSNELRGKGAYEIINTDTDISGFSFEGGTNFNADLPGATITVDASIDVNPAQITPEIIIPFGSSINPASNIERDFSNDVTYIVTSESGTDKVWTISVNRLGLDGTYTVGSGGDFETLANFISLVDVLGMEDRVTLQILDGHEETGDFVFDNLEEPLYIRPETDASTATFNGSFLIDNSRVSFLGEDEENSQQITINGTAQSAAISLVGTREGSRFSNLTINYEGQSGINLNGDGIAVEVIYCTFNHTASSTTSVAVGVSGGVSMDEILVSNSKFLSFNGESIRAVEVYNTAYIFNNVIFMDTPGATSPIGIKVVEGAGEVVIDQNTIHITGGALDQISGSVGVSAKSSASDRFEITNNIISIDRLTNNLGSTVGIIYLTTENTGSVSLTVDHNQIDDYSSLVENWLFGLNNSIEKDISDFSNSTSSLIEFTDSDNGDLTLSNGSIQNDDLRSSFLPAEIPFDEGGTSVNYDHNEIERNALYPSKGAFEYDNELANILALSVPNQIADPVIDHVNRTVTLSITSGADISQVPTIVTSAGSTINPVSGASQNFSTPVNYTVTSEENAVTQDWTVIVNAKPLLVDLDENEHDELMAENTPFTTFFINDPNTNDSHVITLVSGEGDADNAKFSIDDQNLINLEEFDFETQEEYTIRVRATDSEGLFAEAALIVFVVDVNEVPVMADQTFDVSESEGSGFEIGTLTATDPENNPLTFSPLSGEIGSVFGVSTGGVLTLNRSVDFEEEGPYEFTVTVSDDGAPNLESTATITVNVMDANDTPTEVLLSSTSIDETLPINSVVGTLFTEDVDIDDTHTYDLVDEGTDPKDNASFTIIGGQLVSAEVFDFETKNNYEVYVKSTDAGGLTREDLLTISINDLPAQVTILELSNLSVLENQSSSALVGTLSSFGESLSGSFTYTLVAGTGDFDNASFATSGDQLLTAESFDFETKTNYSIRLKTDDGNGNTLEKAFTISVTDEAELSDGNITSFTITEQTGVASIDATAATVSVEVAYGTDLSNLSPSITISEGASIGPASIGDFTNPVSYLVTAEDGSTRNWTVTVSAAANEEANIVSFALADETGPASILTTSREVNVTVALGTDVTDLDPMITVSDGATLSPTGPQDFTNPILYTVTAEDGTTAKEWQVIVDEALSTATDITFFTLTELLEEAEIDVVNHTVTASVVFGTDLTALSPSIDVSEGASISPLGIQDFTNSVTYTVTAQDGVTTQNWLVSISKAANTATEILSASIDQNDATVNTTSSLVSIEVPFGTDITSMEPSFVLSEGASISPVGAQDFTDAVTFTVTAEDGTTTQDWIVTVIEKPEPLSAETDILTFSMAEQTGTTTVDMISHTISIEVATGTDVTSLEPTITVSEGAIVSPSGVQDFTNAVTYTVTAEDATTTQNWQVIVSVETILVTGVMLDDDVETIAEGSTYTLIATVSPMNATNQNTTWTTSDPNVATVDVSGVVTGIAEGTADITVTTEDGDFTDSFEVTVSGPAVTSIDDNITPSDLEVYPNPTSDKLHINAIENRVLIIDVMGHQIEKEVVNGAIDVKGLQSGIYLVGTSQQQFVRFIRK